jgi:hypothetical protein
VPDEVTMAAGLHKPWQRLPGMLPDELAGLWWMDQFDAARKNLLLAEGLPPLQKVGCVESNCTYKHKYSNAADEFVMSFGDGVWDESTKCVGPIRGFGSESGGVWTYRDDIGARSNAEYASDKHIKNTLVFCFTDDTYRTIDIELYHTYANVTRKIPKSQLSFTMVKLRDSPAPVWDRVTNGNEHYPVYQVVDGSGQKTVYYESYLAWVRSRSPKLTNGRTFEHGYSLTAIPTGQCPL